MRIHNTGFVIESERIGTSLSGSARMSRSVEKTCLKQEEQAGGLGVGPALEEGEPERVRDLGLHIQPDERGVAQSRLRELHQQLRQRCREQDSLPAITCSVNYAKNQCCGSMTFWCGSGSRSGSGFGSADLCL
jgi:hypothetical protein